MTSTKSLTCQRIVIGKEATNRLSMNCLGEMRLLTMLKRPPPASGTGLVSGFPSNGHSYLGDVIKGL